MPKEEYERHIFKFIEPIPGKTGGPFSRWILIVGGWEVSGDTEQELKAEAIRILKNELRRFEG